MIDYKGKEFPFSDANVMPILAIRDLPVQDGYLAANKAIFEIITLGRRFEQSVFGDKKSFSMDNKFYPLL